jgi:hypothetical protein
MKRLLVASTALLTLLLTATVTEAAYGPAGQFSASCCGYSDCVNARGTAGAGWGSAEDMLTWHEANLAALKAQLAEGADEATKSALTVRIEWENLHIGWLDVRLPVLKAATGKWLDDEMALATAEVTYWGHATAVDAGNQAWIESRLATAKQHLTYLEELAAQNKH